MDCPKIRPKGWIFDFFETGRIFDALGKYLFFNRNPTNLFVTVFKHYSNFHIQQKIRPTSPPPFPADRTRKI